MIILQVMTTITCRGTAARGLIHIETTRNLILIQTVGNSTMLNADLARLPTSPTEADYA